jgi:hypothetical protein
MRPHVTAALALALAACTPAPMPTEPPAQGEAATQAPAEAIAAIEAQLPGFVGAGAAADQSTRAQGYRVSGTSAGSTYDVQLMHMNQGWTVVAIRRDIAWADTPQAVRAVAGATQPERVVENRQPGADGVIYELYAAGADAPAMEVRFADGQAAVMPPAH